MDKKRQPKENLKAKAIQELKELVLRQADKKEELENLEREIYTFEGEYLRDTRMDGNVVEGFDNYWTRPSSLPASMMRSTRRRKEADAAYIPNERLRIFSNSSITSSTAVGCPNVTIKQEIEDTDKDSMDASTIGYMDTFSTANTTFNNVIKEEVVVKVEPEDYDYSFSCDF